MLLSLILILYGVVVIVLFTWQLSNLIAIGLGAPAISSPRHELWRTFADQKKIILDLGCGNGSFCRRLAPHFRHIYGIEYSPVYYWLAKWRTRHLANVTIYYGHMFRRPWPKTDLIYCYLLPALLARLRPLLRQSKAVVLSFGFAVPGQRPTQTIQTDGQRLYVYKSLGKKASIA